MPYDKWTTRDRESRQKVRDIAQEYKEALNAGRMTKERIQANIDALEAIRDQKRDKRASLNATKELNNWYQWQAEYEQPKTEEVKHTFPDQININVVSSSGPVKPLNELHNCDKKDDTANKA